MKDKEQNIINKCTNLLFSAYDEGVLSKTITEVLEEIEKNCLRRVFENYDISKSDAARLLRLKRTTLLYKMKKYGIVSEE